MRPFKSRGAALTERGRTTLAVVLTALAALAIAALSFEPHDPTTGEPIAERRLPEPTWAQAVSGRAASDSPQGTPQ